MFSGSFKDDGQTTVDIKPELKPSVVANCEDLPFPDNSFDFVCADPPYSKEEAKNLYDMDYCNIIKVVDEGARITKEGGHFLFLHRLIPIIHPQFKHFKRMECVGIVGIFTISGLTNIRALSVWRKRNSLEV